MSNKKVTVDSEKNESEQNATTVEKEEAPTKKAKTQTAEGWKREMKKNQTKK